MGGHGGLNILPQKRWNGESCACAPTNGLTTQRTLSQPPRSAAALPAPLPLPPVYNRDNRLKVAQDEAKAREQEEEARQRHEQAEREHRHQLLLQRARGAAAGGQQAGDEAAAVDQAPGQELQVVQQQQQQPLEHINFWKEEETRVQHPDNEVRGGVGTGRGYR